MTQEEKDLISALERRFGLPCTYYPPMDTDALIVSDYYQAKPKGNKGDFWPMILSEEYARGLLEAPVPPAPAGPLESGKELLQRWLRGAKEGWAEVDPEFYKNWDTQVIGEVSGGEPMIRFLSTWDWSSKKTAPMVLVRVPVKNPWEVFTWLPFGGWNGCPSDEAHMAVAKYWFEEYKAFPSLMTRDVLEYSFSSPYPVPRGRALDLALEQYAYCNDIVDQGVGTIGRLADSLAQSYHWYFWWD